MSSILLDYEEYKHSNWYNLADGYEDVINRFCSNNSLALGKPEPLRKNKQCDDDFVCAIWRPKCNIQCSDCENDTNNYL